MKARHILLLPAVLLMVVIMASCDKKGPCDAGVTVVDTLGRKISGATVVLRQDSVINPTNGTQASVYEVGITGTSGTASFSFKLEAVLILEATYGARDARDYIRLEQSETVSKTVIVK